MLTDTQVRRAKPADKDYKLSDSHGLYLLVTKAGGKSWRWKYRVDGAEKKMTFGMYPEISLEEAREAHGAARKMLAKGIDPSQHKRELLQQQKAEAAITFEVVAREWHRKNEPRWGPEHASDVIGSLERDIFPQFGNKPLSMITPATILDALELVEKRGAIETAHRIRQRVSAVFVYAIPSGRATSDPAASLQPALAPITRGKYPAIIELDRLREMLRACEATPAHPVTKLAHRFLALTAMRVGPLRETPWSELEDLDTDAPLWRVPADRMKLTVRYKKDTSREHWVPLSRQAVEVVAATRRLTHRGALVFPSTRDMHKAVSENTILNLINRSGFGDEHVPHGWRSSFSTIMNERFQADRSIIDLMLAHTPKDKVEAAYNRAAYLDRRRELGQAWADLLMEGMPPAEELLTMRRK